VENTFRDAMVRKVSAAIVSIRMTNGQKMATGAARETSRIARGRKGGNGKAGQKRRQKRETKYQENNELLKAGRME
jgi:ribosomal protein L15